MFSIWLDFLRLFGNLSEPNAFMITSFALAAVIILPTIPIFWFSLFRKRGLEGQEWWKQSTLFIAIFLLIGGYYFYSSYVLKEWLGHFFNCTVATGTIAASTIHFIDELSDDKRNAIGDKKIIVEVCRKKEYIDINSNYGDLYIYRFNFMNE